MQDHRDDAPDDNVLTLPCRHGLLSVYRTDRPIGEALQRYGEWNENELGFLLSLLPRDRVVVDVGAHVGSYTAAFACHVGGSGRVFAFEPQPAIFRLLERNLRQNRLGNVTALDAAAGDRSCTLWLPPLDYTAEANYGAVALRTSPEPGGREVAVRPIDDLPLDRCAAR